MGIVSPIRLQGTSSRSLTVSEATIILVLVGLADEPARDGISVFTAFLALLIADSFPCFLIHAFTRFTATMPKPKKINF